MAPRTVLIVDDVPEQRDIYATLLRHYGYQTMEAENGEDALRISREARPDLILLDMMMAAPDGWTVTELLKQDPETAEIPVVALTVRFALEDQLKARRSGCVGYLIKPCNPRSVLQEVERLLGPSPPPPA